MRRSEASTGDAEESRARQAPDQEDAIRQPTAQAAPTAGSLDPALLGDSRAWHSANGPIRSDLMLQMQRTHGNAYARRLVQALQRRQAAGPVAVQRDSADKGDHAGAKQWGRLQVEASKQGHIAFDVQQFTIQAGSEDGTSIRVDTEVGPHTKALFQAATTDEPIKSVTLDVLRANDTGQPTVTQTFTLHEVWVDLFEVSAADPRTAKHEDVVELVRVGFRSGAAPKSGPHKGK